MSADPGTHPERLGVVATWRLTPTSAKALLAGVFVNRLGGFLQIFLILFLTERGFSAGGVLARGTSVESGIEVIHIEGGAYSGCCLHALPEPG